MALSALGWILTDDRRAHRFMDLTGLTPEGLRATITEAGTHRAIFDFLCAHEPDLLGAADALGIQPAQLVAAKERLAR
ncbi:DUF3572 family protein [Alteraurantiacibacter aestuarii]|uniref:DUF3572 family protein n=1 Tax=Alteraurantiacibacter aestuarii TaxID=650004 RepID=A0A844ZF46_9SPHN|nr:DUF3572 family protein [Alteraurantiacibacter aestuarii]MXO87151.1 DUF3572 family protein [Alteraurantiacibacter aestuarii]